MITDVVVRFAKDIQETNEIANFSRRYGILCENISAISWEKTHNSRKTYSVQLLQTMIGQLIMSSRKELLVAIELSVEQPKSAVVKHKKIWGLLSGEGLRLDKIHNKRDFLLDTGDGLILSGIANVEIEDGQSLNILMNRNDYVYFALVDRNNSQPFKGESFNRAAWMESIWNQNGVIFFPMGDMDESACEIVAMGHENDLLPLTN